MPAPPRQLQGGQAKGAECRKHQDANWKVGWPKLLPLCTYPSLTGILGVCLERRLECSHPLLKPLSSSEQVAAAAVCPAGLWGREARGWSIARRKAGREGATCL